MNEAVRCCTHLGAIKFGGTLCSLLSKILPYDHTCTLILLAKVYPRNPHTHVCIKTKDLTLLTFLLPYHHPDYKLLIGLYLSLLMRYV